MKQKYNKKLREQIRERDLGVCICGREGGHIHHIVHRSHCGSNEPKNLILLCDGCHRLVHSDEKHYVPVLMKYQEERYGKLTKEDLKC